MFCSISTLKTKHLSRYYNILSYIIYSENAIKSQKLNLKEGPLNVLFSQMNRFIIKTTIINHYVEKLIFDISENNKLVVLSKHINWKSTKLTKKIIFLKIHLICLFLICKLVLQFIENIILSIKKNSTFCVVNKKK